MGIIIAVAAAEFVAAIFLLIKLFELLKNRT